MDVDAGCLLQNINSSGASVRNKIAADSSGAFAFAANSLTWNGQRQVRPEQTAGSCVSGSKELSKGNFHQIDLVISLRKSTIGYA